MQSTMWMILKCIEEIYFACGYSVGTFIFIDRVKQRSTREKNDWCAIQKNSYFSSTVPVYWKNFSFEIVRFRFWFKFILYLWSSCTEIASIEGPYICSWKQHWYFIQIVWDCIWHSWQGLSYSKFLPFMFQQRILRCPFFLLKVKIKIEL